MKSDIAASKRFCALEYRALRGSNEELSPALVLLLLVMPKSGSLRLLVAPDWQDSVLPPDREYIFSLIQDFKARAAIDGNGLLKQASSLSVGPLVAHATGTTLTSAPELYKLSLSFVEA